MIHVSGDHEIFLGTSELPSVVKSDFNSDLVHYMYSYDNFAWNKFATAFIEKKKTNLEVFYIVHYDAGLRFNFSLQVKYHCEIAKFFLSNTKMIKYT